MLPFPLASWQEKHARLTPVLLMTVVFLQFVAFSAVLETLAMVSPVAFICIVKFVMSLFAAFSHFVLAVTSFPLFTNVHVNFPNSVVFTDFADAGTDTHMTQIINAATIDINFFFFIFNHPPNFICLV